MEKLVVIIDKMPEYAAQLAVYLNGRRGFPYRAVVFPEPKEVRAYIESGAVYAILAAECFEKDVLELALRADVRVFWFCEAENVYNESALYRYQSAKEIEKKLTEKELGDKRKDLRVFGVYSPAGGSCIEKLSGMIADGFVKEGKVLYLPLVPFGIYKRAFEDGMSELLFYIKQREEAVADFFDTLLQKGEGAHSIGPVRWSTDLREITREDMESLLRFLETKTEYETIVIAVGWFDAVGMTVLRCCDAVLTPVWETEDGRAIQAEFLRQLKESGEVEVLSRITEFPLSCDEESVGLLRAAAEAVEKGGKAVGGHKGGNSVPDAGTIKSFGRINR